MKKLIAGCLLALPLVAAPLAAQAQNWPSKPMRWLVPYPAGGGSDFLARTIGQQLSTQIGQPVVVDNKPGGNTAIAAADVARSAPDVAKSIEACWESMSHDDAMLEIPSESFSQVPDISIDYAVMERSDKVAVVPADFGWSDIGSWVAVRELSAPDADNNRATGDAIFVDSHNTYVHGHDRMVAAVGVADLMIIDTPDALLVAHPDKAQEVKKVVARLKKQDHDAYKLHRTVTRPWGTYTVLEEGTRFKIKRIEVKPGCSLSLQMHHHRSEHWIVVSGMAKVVNGEQELFISTNESTYIPAGHKHRLENPGVLDLVMIEVQSGEYLGEDDIVRFQDNYGRV